MVTEGFVIENGVFKEYTGPEVVELIIPDGVVSIERRAFDHVYLDDRGAL